MAAPRLAFALIACALALLLLHALSDVVIFELTELVRAFLASHNEPASGWDLHRQMLERRAAQDAEAALPRAHLRAAVGGALAPDANLAAELERIASRQEAERTQRLTSERALLKKGGGARARGKRATRESGDAVELDRVASWSAGDDSDADETAAKARGAAGGKAPVKRPPTVDAKPPPAAVPAGEPARPVSFLPVAARPAGARAADGGGGLIGQLMGALSRSFSNLSLSRAGGRESTGSERSAGAEAEAHALAGEGAASSLERAGAAGVGGAGVRRRRAARRAARRSFGGGEAPSSDDEGDEPGGSHRPARPSVPSAALAEPIPYSTSNRFAALRARPELRAPSRYRDDFEVREQLGRGGFGFVYKARNRLDGLLYAIKVIPIAGSDTSARTRKILREVMTLSRLHHENIVRYFQAWLEDAQPRAAGGQSGSDASSEAGSSEEASSDATSDDEDTASQGDSSDDARSASTRAERARAANAPTSLSDGDESGSGAESDSGSLAWHALGPRLGAPDGVDWRGSAAHGTADAPAQRRADRRRAAALPKRRRALYIQMEFCHQTLADRISTAAGALEEDEAWRLFRQVLVGVNYCHAKVREGRHAGTRATRASPSYVQPPRFDRPAARPHARPFDPPAALARDPHRASRTATSSRPTSSSTLRATSSLATSALRPSSPTRSTRRSRRRRRPRRARPRCCRRCLARARTARASTMAAATAAAAAARSTATARKRRLWAPRSTSTRTRTASPTAARRRRAARRARAWARAAAARASR